MLRYLESVQFARGFSDNRQIQMLTVADPSRTNQTDSYTTSSRGKQAYPSLTKRLPLFRSHDVRIIWKKQLLWHQRCYTRSLVLKFWIKIYLNMLDPTYVGLHTVYTGTYSTSTIRERAKDTRARIESDGTTKTYLLSHNLFSWKILFDPLHHSSVL